MGRHEVLVELAQPYSPGPVVAAEIYRLDLRQPKWRWTLLILSLAFFGGIGLLAPRYLPVFNRFTVLAIVGVDLAVVMVVRRIRHQPNLLLIAITAGELVLLRVSFATCRWKVLDEVGRWPTGAVGATPGTEPLALQLTLPGANGDLMELTPLAIDRDAAVIAAALGVHLLS